MVEMKCAVLYTQNSGQVLQSNYKTDHNVKERPVASKLIVFSAWTKIVPMAILANLLGPS